MYNTRFCDKNTKLSENLGNFMLINKFSELNAKPIYRIIINYSLLAS